MHTGYSGIVIGRKVPLQVQDRSSSGAGERESRKKRVANAGKCRLSFFILSHSTVSFVPRGIFWPLLISELFRYLDFDLKL